MKRTYWEKALALVLLTVSLSGIVGCQNGTQPGSSVSGSLSGANTAAGNRIIATMGAVSISQKEVINHLQPLAPYVVTAVLDKEGGLEELVTGLALRKNVASRAVSENWQERAGVKTKIEVARREILYTMYLNEKSEQLPAGYPDDATVAKVYESIKQQPSVAGKPLKEVAPVIRHQLRKNQQQINQQNYVNGLVSGNPVNVDMKRLLDFINLSQEQRQQLGERLKEPVAQMGATYVNLGQVQQSLDSMQPDQQQQLVDDGQQLQQHVALLAIKFFVVNEAKAEKFDVRPAVNDHMDEAGLQVVYTTYMKAWTAPESGFPSAALVEMNYQQNLETLAVGNRYHLANIIILNSGDSAADAIKAKRITDSARTSGADFAALARHYSEQPESAKNGGDIGWLDSQALSPELNQMITGNQPGAIIGPVQYTWGWQLLKLIEHQPARQPTLEEMRPALVDALLKKRRAEKEKEIPEQLLATEPVTIDKNVLRQLRRQLEG